MFGIQPERRLDIPVIGESLIHNYSVFILIIIFKTCVSEIVVMFLNIICNKLIMDLHMKGKKTKKQAKMDSVYLKNVYFQEI